MTIERAAQPRTAPDARQTADMMRALGADSIPGSITVNAERYRLVREVKHDFFAATGFYDGPGGGRVVAKFGRTAEFSGVPLKWLGRRLRDREVRIYRRLADAPAVPCVLAQIEPNGFVTEFIAGEPLRKGLRVPDGFFDRLRELVEQVHARGIAYVDMNKQANVIVGPHGEPHLVDFQISFDLAGAGDNFLTRWLLRLLQREDCYHVAKHHARFRPDELTAEQLAAARRRSNVIRAHRLLTRLYFGLRRRTWQRLRETGRLHAEGSE